MIAILAAVEFEVQGIARTMERIEMVRWQEYTIRIGTLGERQVIVLKTNPGKVFASLVTQRIIDTYAPEAVVATGVAGALRNGITVGDLIVGLDYLQFDMDCGAFGYAVGAIPRTKYRCFSPDRDLLEAARALEKSADFALHFGRIVSGDKFVTDRKELVGSLGYAVDMETAAIAHACTINRTPFLGVKVISDCADLESVASYKKIQGMYRKRIGTVLPALMRAMPHPRRRRGGGASV